MTAPPTSFDVIPALDVAGGRLARWSAGGAVAVDSFDGDPVAAAAACASVGATWLHVVDLDLAFEGRATGIDVIRAIRRAVPDARIQASGGIGSIELVADFLAAGAHRVVVGSAALSDPDRTEEIVGRHGGSILIGLDVDGGRIRSRGREPADLDLMSTLGWLASARAPGVLLTAVARVGRMTGPDVALVRRVLRAGLPVLAAGGISSMRDLRALREAGAAGALVGRAALDGSLDLADALAWAAGL